MVAIGRVTRDEIWLHLTSVISQKEFGLESCSLHNARGVSLH